MLNNSNTAAYCRLQCCKKSLQAPDVQGLQPCTGWVQGRTEMETVPVAAAASVSEYDNTAKQQTVSTGKISSYLELMPSLLVGGQTQYKVSLVICTAFLHIQSCV